LYLRISTGISTGINRQPAEGGTDQSPNRLDGTAGHPRSVGGRGGGLSVAPRDRLVRKRSGG
jgi:hypothetical protein